MIDSLVQALAHASWVAGQITGAPPPWTAVVSIGLCVLLFLGVFALALGGFGDGDGSDDTHGGDSGPGGREPRRPPPSDHGPPRGDPSWWPEFERQFAAHLDGIHTGRVSPERNEPRSARR